MNDLDLPQEGDLMLFVMLGERAKKHWYKQSFENQPMQPLMTGAFEPPPQQMPDLLPVLAAASTPHLGILGSIGGGLHGGYTSRPNHGASDTARGVLVGGGTGLGGGLGATVGAALGGAPGLIGGGLAGALGGNYLARKVFPRQADTEDKLEKKTEEETNKQAAEGEWELPLGLGKVPTPENAWNQGKEWAGQQAEYLGQRAGQGASLMTGIGNFMDRNPWAYAPIIGGGLGAGVGLLGSLGSNNKKKNVLGSMLSGGLLGAGAGGLAWGARELMGDGKPPEAPPAAAAAETKGMGGVERTPFQNPSTAVPPTGAQTNIPFVAPGTTDKAIDAFTKSDPTRTFKTEAQIPVTNAAGGGLQTLAKLNQPADYNRLSEARNRATAPVIGPDGKVDQNVEQAVRDLPGVTKEILGNYAKPTADPISRVGNANAMASVLGFPTLAGVGSSAGPVLADNVKIPGTGAETQANLDMNSKGEAALASGAKPTNNPPWYATAGAKDTAVGATGSAMTRGVLSELAKRPDVDPVRSQAYQLTKLLSSPAQTEGAPATATPAPAPSGGLFGRALKATNSVINPLSGILPPAAGGTSSLASLSANQALLSRMANAANERGLKINGSTVNTDHILKSMSAGDKGPLSPAVISDLAKDVSAGKGMTGASGIPERSLLGRLVAGPIHPQLHHRPAVRPIGFSEAAGKFMGGALSPLKPKNLLVGGLTSALRHATPGPAVPSLVPNFDAAERARLQEELQKLMRPAPIPEQPLEPGGKPVIDDLRNRQRNLGQ